MGVVGVTNKNPVPAVADVAPALSVIVVPLIAETVVPLAILAPATPIPTVIPEPDATVSVVRLPPAIVPVVVTLLMVVSTELVSALAAMT